MAHRQTPTGQKFVHNHSTTHSTLKTLSSLLHTDTLSVRLASAMHTRRLAPQEHARTDRVGRTRTTPARQRASRRGAMSTSTHGKRREHAPDPAPADTAPLPAHACAMRVQGTWHGGQPHLSTAQMPQPSVGSKCSQGEASLGGGKAGGSRLQPRPNIGRVCRWRHVKHPVGRSR